MKSYKDITNKYLKKNLKRTILTICGVILSVALITSIGLFIKCLQNMFVQQEIQKRGTYYVSIQGSTANYKELISNPKIDKIGLVENSKKTALKKGKYIELSKMNTNAFKLLPLKLLKGRFPSKEGEIAIEKWALNYMISGTKLGDTIKFTLSDGKAHYYKLTGLTEDNGQFDGVASGYIYTNKIDIDNSKIYLTIFKKAGISNTIKKLGETYKIDKINSYLLDYMGEGQDNALNSQLYLIAGIIIAIAVIATLAVIYNSFQISVVERIKQFGLLKAVGATPRQIRKIVLREASVISLIGMPLGLLSGIFALWMITIVFKMMSTSIFQGIQLEVPHYVLIISAVIGITTIYVSALIPAHFASKISPLVAISSRTSIVKEKLNKKRGRFLKKFVNISGLMAFKNIKRNRRKFRITVFSIAISVSLFIFFSAFINMTQNFTDGVSESNKDHFIIYGKTEPKITLTSDILKNVKNNKLVKNVYVSYGSYFGKALISNEERDPDAQRIAPEIFNKVNYEGKPFTSIKILYDVYDNEKLSNCNKYVTGGKIDYAKMVEQNGVILVRNNNISKGSGKRYNGPLTKLKPGDSFYVSRRNLFAFSKEDTGANEDSIDFKNKNNLEKVKVFAIVDTSPYAFTTSVSGYLNIIVSKAVMHNISTHALYTQAAEIILKDENTNNIFENWLQPIADANGLSISNIISANKQYKTNNLQMIILMYGFIVVISLIGAVNIINTVTTNLLLRRKEIASLNALGMTYKNIRGMIITEGILYSIYGCFYGTIGGLILSYLCSLPMRDIMNFKLNTPIKNILTAVIVAIIISLLAVIKPLRKIKTENIVEVIRAEE